MIRRTLFFACTALSMLSACQNANDFSNDVADASERSYYDTRDKWRSLFVYKKRPGPQQPQTRYCYNAQSDIVCYDSPQPGMTAKIIGYQDGGNISAFQPGGGALGVSGGEATANYQTSDVHVAPPQDVQLGAAPVAPVAEVATGATPFYSGESAYDKNAVIANEIAAAKAK